jgi:hypothetical protein
MAKVPAPTSFIIFSFFTITLLPVGLLLKWLARGIIQRKRVRMVLSALIFGFLGVRFVFFSSLLGDRYSSTSFDRFVMVIEFLSAAVVLIMGLIKGARPSNG